MDFGYRPKRPISIGLFWSKSAIHDLFIFLVRRMATAATAEFLKLKPVRRVLFILGRDVVTLFALGALQNYVISWHIFSTQHSAISIQQ